MFSNNHKQVLRHGEHFADAATIEAAEMIVAALNAIDPDEIRAYQATRSPPPSGIPCATIHHIERQSDEYACSCGMRWDVSDGEDHP